MRMVAARADSPLATPCTMTEETRELARGSPGDPARSGGRLKFFKDGKFILELVRTGAGSEGAGGWVSVPRKTFWPPAGPATPPHAAPGVQPNHARTDRATSLSVSDDNSSVQSSPWQRDHCWKQTAPRRNIGKELAFYYCRPSHLLNATIAAASRLKRRRPLHTTVANGNGDTSNGSGSPSEDAVDGWIDRERYYHMKLKKPFQYRKLRAYKKCRPQAARKPLLTVVEKLRERVAALPTPVNAKIQSCRQEHAMVSPRKRILRELERVSLEGASDKRRAKSTAAPTLSTASYPPSPGPSQPRPANGSRATPKHRGSYSIDSLLSTSDSPPESKRRTPLKTETPSPVSSPAPPPRASPHHPVAYRGSPAPPHDMYGYVYSGYGPPLLPYRAPPPPPPWLHYLPPGSWPPLAHPLFTHHIPKEEPSSDLPLNLSKH